MSRSPRGGWCRLSVVPTLALALFAGSLSARAQEAPPPPQPFPEPAAPPDSGGLPLGVAGLKLKAEIKAHFRDSKALDFPISLPSGGTIVASTVAPYASFEVSDVELAVEGTLSSQVFARAVVHVLDLYNRNPTSSDDRIALREAWIRFGKRYDGFRLPPGTTLYVQAGKAPRFSKQLTRRLESYGIWTTAVNRFEELGVEAGGSFGRHVYWRGALANGNPLFMRDLNSLAGDNGTPERTPDSTEPSVYGSGFPILYDAKAQELGTTGKMQWGGGLGVRFASEDGRKGVDLLAWAFGRQLADHASIRGSYYGGDLDLLDGIGPGLPVTSRTKTDLGANLEARLERFSLFGQVVRQDIAGLVRWGFDVEASYRFPLPGLFALGDAPFLNWVQPAVRYSFLENDFTGPKGFVAPSFFWDWRKLDFGLRTGLVRGVDLTVEYARHDMITARGTLHPDELLVTLRAGY